MTKTIFCDVDGVVADLHAEWLRRYNADYGDTLTLDRILAWDMRRFVRPECGARIYDYLHQPDLYDAVPVVPGAAEGVEELRSMGHRVVFTTACAGPVMASAKAEWLFRHRLLPMPYQAGMHDLIIVQDKGLAVGDLLIDDYPGNLRAFNGRGILYAAPYNAEERAFPVARSWTEVPWAVSEALARVAA